MDRSAQLPFNVWIKIFGYVGERRLRARVARVCTRFRDYVAVTRPEYAREHFGMREFCATSSYAERTQTMFDAALTRDGRTSLQSFSLEEHLRCSCGRCSRNKMVFSFIGLLSIHWKAFAQCRKMLATVEHVQLPFRRDDHVLFNYIDYLVKIFPKMRVLSLREEFLGESRGAPPFPRTTNVPTMTNLVRFNTSFDALAMLGSSIRTGPSFEHLDIVDVPFRARTGNALILDSLNDEDLEAVSARLDGLAECRRLTLTMFPIDVPRSRTPPFGDTCPTVREFECVLALPRLERVDIHAGMIPSSTVDRILTTIMRLHGFVLERSDGTRILRYVSRRHELVAPSDGVDGFRLHWWRLNCRRLAAQRDPTI